MNEIMIIDDREKRDVKILADILYDNISIERLDIGDFLCRGVIFEHKRPEDFVSSIFSRHLFTQIGNMTEHYKYSFILISGDYRNTELIYNSRSKIQNFSGVIGSCIAHGSLPIFANNIENCIKLVDTISKKLTDGKIRDRPVKRVNLKDKQLSIVMSLPGISDKRAKDLLSHFGNIISILTAPENEIVQVPGVGPKTAKKLADILRKPYKG